MSNRPSSKLLLIASVAGLAAFVTAQIVTRPPSRLPSETVRRAPAEKKTPTRFSARLHVDAVATAPAGDASHTKPAEFLLSVYEANGAPYEKLTSLNLSFQFVMPDQSLRATPYASVTAITNLGNGVYRCQVKPPSPSGSNQPGSWLPGETLAVVQVDDVVLYREGGSTTSQQLLTLGRAVVKLEVR